MNRLKLVLFVAALALPLSSAQAVEWVVYDGTIPDNAVRLGYDEGTGDAVVCRHKRNLGLVTAAGKCHSVSLRNQRKISRITQEKGYEILVDNPKTHEFDSESELAAACGRFEAEETYGGGGLNCTTKVQCKSWGRVYRGFFNSENFIPSSLESMWPPYKMSVIISDPRSDAEMKVVVEGKQEGDWD